MRRLLLRYRNFVCICWGRQGTVNGSFAFVVKHCSPIYPGQSLILHYRPWFLRMTLLDRLVRVATNHKRLRLNYQYDLKLNNKWIQFHWFNYKIVLNLSLVPVMDQPHHYRTKDRFEFYFIFIWIHHNTLEVLSF